MALLNELRSQLAPNCTSTLSVNVGDLESDDEEDDIICLYVCVCKLQSGSGDSLQWLVNPFLVT